MAAQLGADFANSKVGETNDDCEVYNVNFPMDPKVNTPWVATQPGKIHFRSLFQSEDNNTFRFAYEERIPEPECRELPCDYTTYSEGNISVSLLNFNQLGKDFSIQDTD